MTSVDLTIILLYVVALFTVGVLVGLRETADDYLVLSRKAGFFLVLASVVSTWVGVGVFVGVAASGYKTGISLGFTGAAGALVAVVVAGIFAPRIKAFGDRYQAHTLGDFFRIRYSVPASRLAGIVIILVYLLLTAVQFTGLSKLLQVWSGMSLEIGLIVVAVSTILYTAFAGIKSDFYTDAVHFIVMFAVFFGVLLPRLWNETHGLRDLASLPSQYFDPFAFGGVGYFVGGLVLGIAVVFVSMEVWQRIYASTSPATARWGLVGSGFLILPFYVLATLIGLAARTLYSEIRDPDLTLFLTMKDHLPSGLLGLGVAAFIALFISSVNTMIMVASATITKDFLGDRLGDVRQNSAKVLTAARLSTFFVGLIGLGVSYVVNDIVTLSVVAIFLLLVLLPSVIGGFFWRRATAQAAAWSVAAGVFGNAVVLPFAPATAFVPGFLASIVVFVIVSLRTTHNDSESIVSLPRT